MTMRPGALLAIGAASVMLLFGLSTYGQQVTVTYTGVANTSVQALGAYGGYYTGTVNGTPSSPGFICDDYSHDLVSTPQTWQATPTSFASLATSSAALAATMFGKSIGTKGYAEIAYLANLMAVTPASGQGAISAAIWSIGDSAVKSLSSWTAVQSAVTSLLASADSTILADGGSANYLENYTSGLWLYTPNLNSNPMPQEFVGYVAVPEGGAPMLYLLLGGLCCFSALWYRRRGQC